MSNRNPTTTTSDGERCAVGAALDRLPDDVRADIQSLLDNSISSVTLSIWFSQTPRKFKGCTPAAVTNHRKGTCGCS